MTREEDKKRALEVIAGLPEDTVLKIGGCTFAKKEMIERIDDFVDSLDGLHPAKSNILGKRYVCLNCRTEVLCTTASNEMVSCCEQNMWVREPKWIPSAD